MSSSEKKDTQPTRVQENLDVSNQTNASSEAENGKSDEAKSNFSLSENKDIRDKKRIKLQWKYEQFYAQFMFLLDLGWKAVGLFYAILGGILVLSFAKESSAKDVIKFLLYAPLFMSIILSVIFFFCGVLWLFSICKFNKIFAPLRACLEIRRRSAEIVKLFLR
ncbi:MAG TPA: hypothetical protein VK400_12020 [Pyrinomonadaceae bacterium]|nr:hypothetical protein [Pyrinomonadaceae bacterium]